jgi:Pectate lyase superfamily protein
MKTTVLKILVLFLLSQQLFSQIGIGTTSPKAALDVVSANEGILIPRIALVATNVATVSTPTVSEMVYNTSTSATGSNQVVPGFYYWNGSLWIKVSGDSVPSEICSFGQFSQRPTNLTTADAGKKCLYTQTGNFHLWNGTNWSVLNQSVNNVKDYGAIGDGVNDDSIPIQFCLDNFNTIFIPKGNFYIKKSLKVVSNKNIKGFSKKETFLYREPVIKTDFGNVTSISGVVDNYNVNSVFTMLAPANSWNLGSEISDLTLISASTTPVDYGFYAPRMGKFTIRNIDMSYINYGYLSYDSYLGIFQKVDQNFGKTLIGLLKDSSGFGGGTTMNLSDLSCGGSENIPDSLGYDINGLSYSSFTHCSVDGHQMAFKFENCRGITMSGCGMELINIIATTTPSAAISINASEIVFNGFRAFGVYGANNAVESSYLLIYSNSRVVFNSCFFYEINPINGTQTRNYKLYFGARVISNNTILPSGGLPGDVLDASLQINDGLDIKQITNNVVKTAVFN